MTTENNTLLPHEEEALDQLKKLTDNYNYPIIPESLFVNKYLPILTYNYSRPESEHIKVPTEIWVREVSQNPYYIVNVVSDVDPKVVLYWVPPVLRRGDLFRQSTSKDSFFEVMQTAALKGKVIPGAKDAHLNVELTKRLHTDDSLTEDQRQWFNITTYYGIQQYGAEPIELVKNEKPIDDAISFGDVNEL